MTKSHLVSVIIPTYNRACTIIRAISSVLAQSYNDYEIIIVDDGSTDDTESVIKSINDERIRYIKNEHKGATFARNIGIKLSKGRFIAFQDSDDEWLPEKLSLQMKVFEKAGPKVGVVYSSFLRISDSKKEIVPGRHKGKLSGDIFKNILRNNFVTTQTAIVARECFDKVGMFNESLPRLQDWELWLRISQYYNFIHIDKPLVIAYVQKDSISNSVQNLLEAMLIIEKKYIREFNKYDPFALANKYCWLGRLLCKEGRNDEGMVYISKSITICPYNVKFKLVYYYFIVIKLFKAGLKLII